MWDYDAYCNIAEMSKVEDFNSQLRNKVISAIDYEVSRRSRGQPPWRLIRSIRAVPCCSTTARPTSFPRHAPS